MLADWHEVWHSPHPPVILDSAISLVVIVLILFIFEYLRQYLSLCRIPLHRTPVNLMRVVIGNLLRGLLFGSTFWISLGGVVLSSLVLIILDYMKASLLFTSVISSIAHSVGQVLVVMAFYRQPMIMTILPYLLAGSVPMGMITGYTAGLMLKRIKPLQTRING